jgi:hypothetical protein
VGLTPVSTLPQESGPTKVTNVQLPRRPVVISLTLVILALALTSLLVVIAVYRWRFGSSLSDSSEEWARFGEYLGGVLGPLFSLFALVGVLWTIKQTQQQQFDNTFFNLVQRLAQVREASVSRATPGVIPNIHTASPSHQVPMQLLVREAWEELRRQLTMAPEEAEGAAERHMTQLVAHLRQKYGDVFRLTDKIFQLYRFIHRAPLSAATTSYYVEIVNSEVTPMEQTLLLFGLVSQPANGAAFAVVNDLKAFISLALDRVPMATAYRNLLNARFPHLPRSAQDRAMLAV